MGGHTTRFSIERTPLLAAAVLGMAKRLITSFDAKPGHDLVMAVDMRAAYRGDGTLAMLLATSRCGATVNLDALPRPEGIDLQRWLLSFPSFGYLLSVDPAHTAAVKAAFHQRDIACEVIGQIQAGCELALTMGGERCVFAEIAPAVSAPDARCP